MVCVGGMQRSHWIFQLANIQAVLLSLDCCYIRSTLDKRKSTPVAKGTLLITLHHISIL